jgi:hypothetical protein
MKKLFALGLAVLAFSACAITSVLAQDGTAPIQKVPNEGMPSIPSERSNPEPPKTETPEKFKPLLGSWSTTGRSWTVAAVSPSGEVVLRDFFWNGPNPKVTARAVIGSRGEARLVLSIPSEQWGSPLITDLGCASVSCEVMIGKNIYTPAYQTDAKAYRKK